jgi:DNA-directed RNA polymerase sigma subunit (sigma70/sigma32)
MNYGEYTYSEIAKELGVSRERVRQIEKEALKKLAVQFRQLGYDETYIRDIENVAFYTGCATHANCKE